MARKPIYAAGGVVIRDGARPLVAIVQRSKDERWVLPRGKLKRSENPRAGARREATEETGHRVRLHEFLGAITYRTSGRPKVVQFWCMQAAKHPSFDLMKDISAVAWLPLPAAIMKLSYPLEKLFLRHVGRQALQQRARSCPARRAKTQRRKARRGAAKPATKTSTRKSKRTGTKTKKRPPAPQDRETAPAHTLSAGLAARNNRPVAGPVSHPNAAFPPGFLQKINESNGVLPVIRNRPFIAHSRQSAGTYSLSGC